jgi:cytochrome c556
MTVRSLVIGCAMILLAGPVIAAEPTAQPPTAQPPVVAPNGAPAANPVAPDPAKIVAYRETLMGGAGKHMKAASMVLKGDIPRPQDLAGHASALHDMGVGLVDLFPASTAPSKVKTEAKAEIWSTPEKFKEVAQSYEVESQKLVDIAKTGDLAAYQAQFGVVGKACGACHDGFRVKD